MLGSPAFKKPRQIQSQDIAVLGLIALLLYGLITTAQRWKGAYLPQSEIDLRFRVLPTYAVFSLYRALIAYGFSLGFTLVVGYAAARNALIESFVVPLLDICQSIPVLGFLPGLVLGLVAIFPHTNVGLELACVIMIFTGQVWNMTFSFITSLKAVPTQLLEMTDNVGLGRFQKLVHLELPCAATGLAWNSLMSMAGGWFFLIVCESFTLGQHTFRLPGLGSYMALAIERGRTSAIWAGVAAMMLVILFMDFVVWRPIVAWTGKFQLTEQNSVAEGIPFMSLLLRDSPIFRRVADTFMDGLKWLGARRRSSGRLKVLRSRSPRTHRRFSIRAWFRMGRGRIQKFRERAIRALIITGLAISMFWIIGKVFTLVETVRWIEWREILTSTGFTALRVGVAIILSSLWTVPAGIAIGSSPKWTRILQPVIQLGASFPAPMLYPLALAIFIWLGLGLSVSATLLMMLGVQWYILFNVLAGAIGISQDLRESFRLIGMSRWSTWQKLYLPSVFPYLVTGWVTAAGGAWNASILAEYIKYRGDTMSTRGLGAIISQATEAGDFRVLSAALIVMVTVVVALNRTFWSKLYELAENRFRFER